MSGDVLLSEMGLDGGERLCAYGRAGFTDSSRKAVACSAIHSVSLVRSLEALCFV